MRAVLIEEDRSLAVHEVEKPEPGPGQVRLRVEACGICGSDLHMLPSAELLPAGTIMGHEFAGAVDAVGDGVEGWEAGDRACVFPGKPIDRHDIAVQMLAGIGLGPLPGGYAEAVVCDAECLWRLPDGMDTEHGALVEPLSVALHGLDIAGFEPDQAAVVLGLGPIGAMVLCALRARGAERVVAVEPNPERAAFADAVGVPAVGLDGVHEAVIGALGGVAPARVFECAGHPSAPPLAIELVASSGVVCLLGVLEEPVEISQFNLMLKEAQVRASFGYRPQNFDEAIDLIAAGKVPVDRLVTSRHPLDRAGEMFAELVRPGTPELKVLLRP